VPASRPPEQSRQNAAALRPAPSAAAACSVHYRWYGPLEGFQQRRCASTY
jgi:hypothetical protein